MAKEGILALLEKGGDEDTEDSDEVDAAKDIIAAVKSGDAKALSMALSRHYAACEGKGSYDEDEE